MKELSIEQKAQRYDEALKKAKEWFNAEKPDSYTCIIESIFPELKESEDERIRKEIIAFIKKRDRSGCDYDYDQWIAWLEKQCEQPRKVSIWKHWKNGIAGNGEGKLIYLIKNGDDYSLSSCLGFECDYIELSELDKLMQEEKQGEQKPNYCHHEVDLSGCSEEYCKAYYDGWNNCNQQHAQLAAEQKPVWSEKDKQYFNFLEKLLENLQVKSTENQIKKGTTNNSEYYYKVIQWLKSIKLQKHWKPSDEQLKSLQEVIDAGHFTSYPNAIETLYEQLKQL